MSVALRILLLSLLSFPVFSESAAFPDAIVNTRAALVYGEAGSPKQLVAQAKIALRDLENRNETSDRRFVDRAIVHLHEAIRAAQNGNLSEGTQRTRQALEEFHHSAGS
jgi:hypothetical protein